MFNKFVKTSAIPVGAESVAALLAKIKCCGNKNDPHTATTAAKNVLNIYNMITRPKRRSILLFEDDKALVIKTKTKIGAMDFKEPLNISPKIPTGKPLTKIPNNVPQIKPITIRKIRLVSLYFFTTDFNPPIYLSPFFL